MSQSINKNGFDPLVLKKITEDDLEVLRLAGLGLNLSWIGSQMGISRARASQRARRILERFDSRTLIEAAAKMSVQGLIDPDIFFSLEDESEDVLEHWCWSENVAFLKDKSKEKTRIARVM